MRGAGDGGSSCQEEDGGGPGRHGEVVVVVGLKHEERGEAAREPACVCVGERGQEKGRHKTNMCGIIGCGAKRA